VVDPTNEKETEHVNLLTLLGDGCHRRQLAAEASRERRAPGGRAAGELDPAHRDHEHLRLRREEILVSDLFTGLRTSFQPRATPDGRQRWRLDLRIFEALALELATSTCARSWLFGGVRNGGAVSERVKLWSSLANRGKFAVRFHRPTHASWLRSRLASRRLPIRPAPRRDSTARPQAVELPRSDNLTPDVVRALQDRSWEIIAGRVASAADRILQAADAAPSG